MRSLNVRPFPRVTPRYWTAILLASMCGTNLGDFFPDILKMGIGSELAVLVGFFAGLRMVEVLFPRKFEAVYWLSILMVRAAATAIADFLIDTQHFGFIATGVRFAAVLAVLVAIPYLWRRPQADEPLTDGIYWFTMLIAGTLGTIMGDGIGHAFPSVQVGVPVSAALGAAALFLVLRSGGKEPWPYGVRYWIAIVAVRWWGTNTGDIFKFLASLPVSMAVTGVGMAILLFLWRDRMEEQDYAALLLDLPGMTPSTGRSREDGD